MKSVDNVIHLCYTLIKEKRKKGEWKMKIEFSFRKDAAGIIYATAGGWTNEFTPDGDVDTSLEHHTGEVISPEEAEDILEEYGWAICPQCGNIYPALSDCPKH